MQQPPFQIPANIFELAKQHSFKSVEVSRYFKKILAAADLTTDDSPADYPQEVWEIYKALADAPFSEMPEYKPLIERSIFFAGLSDEDQDRVRKEETEEGKRRIVKEAIDRMEREEKNTNV